MRETLADVFDAAGGAIPGIADNIAEGHLWALALLTSNYGTGQSVVWTQGRDLREWERPDRRSRNTALTLDHVLASSALPLFFPAVRLGNGWHGDGGIRLTAPLLSRASPGRKPRPGDLDAGTRRPAPSTTPARGAIRLPCRSPGSSWTPSSSTTSTATHWSWNASTGFSATWRPKSGAECAPSSLLVIRPSVDISRLAAEYEAQLPRVFRHLVRGLGSREIQSPDLLSLLTFEPAYLTRLMELGETDAAAHADRIHALLRSKPARSRRPDPNGRSDDPAPSPHGG